MTPRASELKALAELVADAIALHEQERRTGVVMGYRPALLDPAMAAAFDAAMERYGCPVRAWRKEQDAPKAQRVVSP